MKTLRIQLPVIVFLFFELVVGIMLFINPEEFTRIAILIFGITMLVNSVIFVAWFLISKKRGDEPGPLSIVVSVISFVIGLICVIFTDWILGLFAVIVTVYGVFLIVSGIFKIKSYVDVRKAEIKGSVLMIAAAVLSIILGTVIVLHPIESTVIMWRFAGGALVFEALLDIVALIMSVRSSPEE